MLKNHFFTLSEQKNKIEPNEIDKVVKNEIIGCVFRNIFDKDICKNIINNLNKKKLLNLQNNISLAYDIAGANHYNQKLNDYLEASNLANNQLEQLFENTINPYKIINSLLCHYYQRKNVIFRIAKHGGHNAGNFVIRRFKNNHPYIVPPHEDLSQCSDEKQKFFEIQHVKKFGNVIGCNICLENDIEGNLTLWNFRPEKTTLNTLRADDKIGLNYNIEHLKKYQQLSTPIFPGDVYFINASYVHAVSATNNKPGFRSTLSNFMGQIDSNTIASWT